MDLVTRNRVVADAALRPWIPAFIHGDFEDVIFGYGNDIDLDVSRGWWSFASLLAVRCGGTRFRSLGADMTTVPSARLRSRAGSRPTARS